MSDWVKLAGGVLVGLAAIFGLAFAFGSQTENVAAKSTNAVVDTFRLRVGYEMQYLRKDVDTVKSELRAYIRSQK